MSETWNADDLARDLSAAQAWLDEDRCRERHNLTARPMPASVHHTCVRALLVLGHLTAGAGPMTLRDLAERLEPEVRRVVGS